MVSPMGKRQGGRIPVILALDPGRTSGYSVWSNGILRAHGTAKNARDRARAMAEAIAEHSRLGGAKEATFTIVAEEWSAGGWGSYKTLIGLGAEWGKWLAIFEDLAIRPSQIVRVQVREWRKCLIKFPGRKVADWKAVAVRHCELKHAITVSHDVAEAIVIGEWAVKQGNDLRRGM